LRVAHDSMPAHAPNTETGVWLTSDRRYVSSTLSGQALGSQARWHRRIRHQRNVASANPTSTSLPAIGVQCWNTDWRPRSSLSNPGSELDSSPSAAKRVKIFIGESQVGVIGRVGTEQLTPPVLHVSHFALEFRSPRPSKSEPRLMDSWCKSSAKGVHTTLHPPSCARRHRSMSLKAIDRFFASSPPVPPRLRAGQPCKPRNGGHALC